MIVEHFTEIHSFTISIIDYFNSDETNAGENEQESNWHIPGAVDQHLLHRQQLPGQMGTAGTWRGVAG